MDFLCYLCKKVSMLEEIKNILGQPYFECKYGLLYNMDCEKALTQLREPCLASTITSPPYNIGKEYEQIMPLDDYINWLARIAASIEKITLPDGNFIFNVGYLSVKDKGRAVPISYLVWNRIPFYLNQEIIWHYEAGVAAKKYLSPRNEKILWYVKNKDSYTFNLDSIRDPNVKYPNQKKNGRLRCNSIGKNPSDIWEIAKVTSGTNRASIERTSHPAQFPEDLIRRLILGFTNKDDLVLDPFMGSGTVASVSVELNRRFIGFEINPIYCEIAKKRIELKIQQCTSLFDLS